MKLIHLNAVRYRSLRELDLPFEALNVLIGANGSGKSNILDALRLLAEGVREGDFAEGVNGRRGGIVHLAWKGETASEVGLVTRFREEDRQFVWGVNFERRGFEFQVRERLAEVGPGDASRDLLDARGGVGWWLSGEPARTVPLRASPTACSLAKAGADASFPGRPVVEVVQGWGFFDPSPALLRGASPGDHADRLDSSGRNLAARLHAIKEGSPERFDRILAAARSVLGLPEAIEFRVSEVDGRVYFVQKEPGLRYPVHQVGASSGTLRMLALMTALFGEAGASLVGLEEPENHVHPSAVQDFVEHLKAASVQVQVVVTTHSPLLLDALGAPEAVCVVRRAEGGTVVRREARPEAVREALLQSGFALGEFHHTKGFGA